MAAVKKTLSEKDLALEAEWMKRLAESADVEESEVRQKMQARFAEYASLDALKGKPVSFILTKVKNRVDNDFKGLGGLEAFVGFLETNVGEAKDWNAIDYKTCIERCKTPDAVLAAARADPPQIAFVVEMVDGQPVRRPVRKLLAPMKKGRDKKWYVVQETVVNGVHAKAYELWEKPGDPVIPLDVHPKLKDGKTDNNSFGGELKPNWGVTISGMLFLKKDADKYCPRRATIQVYGDLANPANEERDEKGVLTGGYIVRYLEEKGLFGVPVLFKGVLNEDKTTPSMFIINVRRQYKCVPWKEAPAGLTYGSVVDAWAGNIERTGDAFDVFENGKPGKLLPEGPAILEEACNKGMMAVYKAGTAERVDMLYTDAIKENEKATKAKPPKPAPYETRLLPLARVTIDGLREWHEKYQMTTDEFGVAFKKNDEGKDVQVKNRGRFALLECSGKPGDAPEPGQSIRMVLRDSADPDVKMSVFLPRTITRLSFSSLADLKLVVQTRKKEDYWDTTANTRLGDSDGTLGEITVDVYAMMVDFVHPEDDGDEEGPGELPAEPAAMPADESPEV